MKGIFIILTQAFVITSLCSYNLQAQPTYDEQLVAQSYLNREIITPSSPQADAISRMADIKVNQFVGSANVTIPLHSFQVGQFSLPLLLSASTDAHKVASRATWVGMGWNLSISGAVSRSVRGKPDVKANYYDHAEAIEKNSTSGYNMSKEYSFMSQVLEFEIDPQSDLYHYHAPGISGKFIITPHKEVIQLEFTDNLIIPDFNSLGRLIGFQIKTINGTSYTFAAVESHRTTDDSGMHRPFDQTFNNAWHLTKIFTYDGTVVSYEYDDYLGLDSDGYYSRTNGEVLASKTYKISNTGTNTCCPSGSFRSVGGNDEEDINRLYLSKVNVGRISSSEGPKYSYYSIDFEHSSSNKKFSGWHARQLDAIIVKAHNFGGEEEACVKRFDLTYYESESYRRLFLRKIQEKSCNGEENIPPFEISYNNVQLPSPASSSQDHWGYANAASDATSSMIPTIDGYGENANREPSERYMKARSIKSIKYPTGATTHFGLEPHYAQDDEIIGGLRVHQIVTYDQDEKVLYKRDYNYLDSQGKSSAVVRQIVSYISSRTYRNYPRLKWHQDKCNSEYTCSSIVVTASNTSASAAFPGSHVVYHSVTEKIPQNGRIESIFQTVPLGVENQLMSVGLGNLLSRKIYHRNGVLLKEEINIYELRYPDASASWSSYSVVAYRQQDNKIYMCWNDDPGRVDWHQNIHIADDYDHYHVVNTKLRRAYNNIASPHVYLTTSEKIDHYYDDVYSSPSGSVSAVTEYTLHESITKPTEVKIWQNNTVLRKIAYRYVVDETCANANIYCQLRLNNFIGLPLEIAVNDGSGGKQRVTYGNLGKGIIKGQYFTYDTDELEWRKVSSIVEVNDHNLPTQIQFLEEEPVHLGWSGPSVGYMSQGTYRTDYAYHPNGKLEFINDIDGQQIDFEYDQLSRLEETSSRDEQVTSTYNYVYGSSGNKIINTSSIASTNYALSSETTVDGLGRQVMRKQLDFLPDNTNLEVVNAFDVQGRRTSVTDPTKGSKMNMVYEESPLSRLASQNHKGWSGSTNFHYTTNTTPKGDYGVNSLHVTRKTDENGNVTQEYKNVLGQIVLTSVNGAEDLETYFKYDDRGNVSHIRPPSETSWTGLASFQYKYDGLGRLEEKKLPGQSGWNVYTYTDNDKIDTHTDPNGNIVRYVYDEQQNLIEVYHLSPTTAEKLVQEYFYEAGGTSSVPADPISLKIIETGKLIWERHRIDGSDEWIRTDYIYDSFGRLLNSTTNTINEGVSTLDYVYDMADLLESLTHTLNSSSASISYRYRYTYDRGMRQKKVSHHLLEGGGASITTLSDNIYDSDTGWLVQKKLGNGPNWLQIVDYRYNVRGWLTHINELPPHCSGYQSPPITEGDKGTTIDGEISVFFDEHGFVNGSGGKFVIQGTEQIHYSGELISEDYIQDGFILGDSHASDLDSKAHSAYKGSRSPEILSQDLSNQIYQATSLPNGTKPSLTDMENVRDNIQSRLGPSSTGGCINPQGDVFSLRLYYDDLNSDGPNLPGGTNQHNGNISRAAWHSADRQHIDSYTYTYDYADRLTDAVHHEMNFVRETTYGGRYSSSYDYDPLGNITEIRRMGASDPHVTPRSFEMIDDITLVYESGNRLLTSEDISDIDYGHRQGLLEYSYDDNGNMTEKGSNQVIKYNHLNLPNQISTPEGVLDIEYDASGRKHSQISPSGTRQYIDGIELVDGKITSIVHPEGRISFIDEVSKFEYVVTDHLGNTRITFSDINKDGSIDPRVSAGEILQENHYYPFGLGMNNPDYATSADPENRYQYNGKENVSELGIGLLDYGARWYDPSIARWGQVDPLSETAHSISMSPYHYVANNPISAIDPDGRDYLLIIDLEAETVTIQATLYIKKGDNKSKEAAQGAANYWNSESGNFAISLGSKKNKREFRVNFEIDVIESENPRGAATKDEEKGNFLEIVPDSEMETNFNEGLQANQTQGGITQKGNHIKLPGGASTGTAAHEVGHVLGIETHSNGLMSAIRMGNDKIYSKHIKQIVRNISKNKEETSAGIGSLKDGSPLSPSDFRKVKAYEK